MLGLVGTNVSSILIALCVVGGAAGCVKPDAVLCSNGVACPAGTQCDTANGGCIVEAQKTVCNGLEPDTACPMPDGSPGLCTNGVCLGHVCGDGRKTGPESCDPSAEGATTTTCQMLGYYQGSEVTCAADCTWNRATCSEQCGDDILNGNELCETTIPIAGTCVDYGFDRGTLGCAACNASTQQCGRFGWVARTLPVGLPGAGHATATAVYITDTGRGHTELAYVFQAGVWQPMGTYSTSAGATGLDIHAISDSDVYAVGSQTNGTGLGFLAHYNGTAWTLVHEFPQVATRVFAAGGHVYVISGTTTLNHFDGTTWTTETIAAPGTDVDPSITGTSADDVWIASGKLYHGGGNQAFTEVALPVVSQVPIAVAAFDADTVAVLAGTSSSQAYVHVRRNGTWQSTPRPAPRTFTNGDIYMLSATSIYTLLRNGTIYWSVAHTEGTDWRIVDDAQFAYGNRLGAGRITQITASVGQGLVGVAGGRSYHYQGSVWNKPQQPPAETTSLWAMSPDAVYSFEQPFASNAVHRLSETAWTWANQTAKGPVDGVEGSVAYAFDHQAGLGVSTPTIWKSTTPGTWTSTILPTSYVDYFQPPFAVRANGDVFLFGSSNANGNHIMHWTGSALETTNIPDNDTVNLTDMDCADSGPCAAVGNSGLVYTTPGDRNGWAALPGAPAVNLHSVWVGDGIIAVGGQTGEIAIHDGSQWSSVVLPLPEPVSVISGRSKTDLFALLTTQASGGYRLYHFDGTAWTQVRAPADEASSGITGLYVGRDYTYLVGGNGVDTSFYMLARSEPW